uniref:Ig-like domain-containing protein n=1 Tax=Castor canadensis TaxID=51338 RepID=A0A8C0W2S0_CASCN
MINLILINHIWTFLSLLFLPVLTTNYYLIFPLSGSWAQSVLTQPSSMSSVSAFLGSSARLNCTLSSGFEVPGYHISWYQQKTESMPQFLLRYYSDSDKYQGPGVPSRFSGSKDASASAGILLISGLQPEDEADYYCDTVGLLREWQGLKQTHCSQEIALAVLIVLR